MAELCTAWCDDRFHKSLDETEGSRTDTAPDKPKQPEPDELGIFGTTEREA
jgi:hypothetical protein